MRSYTLALALAGAAIANPLPQGVTGQLAPKTAAPPGCKVTVPGTFEIQVVNVTSSGSKVKVCHHDLPENVTDTRPASKIWHLDHLPHQLGHERPSWPHWIHCCQ